MSEPMGIGGNIKRSIEYARDIYGAGAPGWGGYTYTSAPETPEQAQQRAEIKAKIDAAQPRLKAAVDAYLALTERDDLTGTLAAMHSPEESWSPDCNECGEVIWPCTTAETIAHHHGIDLTDAYLYRWDESQ